MSAHPDLPYGGYHKPRTIDPDTTLTAVGPGTPCGEYLRRYWHPIAMTNRLGEVPMLVRILGEDLVLFRTRSGALGLVHKHCSHRGMSLEFGIIEEHGIRCAYHGWAYAPSGTILDTPSEPPGSRIKSRVCHGAYKVVENHGLIFAYMGPPSEEPPFPHFDSMHLSSADELVPYQLSTPCNWLQVHENAADPVHTAYLHAIVSGIQFTPSFASLPHLDFKETEIGLVSLATRRCGENAWIRASDVILPNVAQFGTGTVDGSVEKIAHGAAFTRWITPVDDLNCFVIGYRHFNRIIDPNQTGVRERIGFERLDLMGQTPERPYAMRQRSPGDYDAMVGQGPVVARCHENLGSTDRGVALLRRQLREGIRDVQDGRRPKGPYPGADGLVATYNNETILAVGQSDDEQAILARYSQLVTEVAFETRDLPLAEKQAHFTRRLRGLQAAGAFTLN